ncbi:hypothetical protein, partial [Mycobacterium gordonae]|uniref:hypothetical protein n=1 Tax=Mycobacterium gordonae TaxID=1778 RepID=UPI000A98C550
MPRVGTCDTVLTGPSRLVGASCEGSGRPGGAGRRKTRGGGAGGLEVNEVSFGVDGKTLLQKVSLT